MVRVRNLLSQVQFLLVYVVRLCFVLLVSWPGGPRDLHSFPTRRSSDLSACKSSATATGCGSAASSACSAVVAPVRTRSEEHTSELQSRPHLVCRLLLEKKKARSGVLCETARRRRGPHASRAPIQVAGGP